MVRRAGLIPALLSAALLWVAPAQAHLWAATAPDLDPAEIEAVVSSLETAADAAEKKNWHPEAEGDPASITLAYDLLSETGSVDALSEPSQRILLTYDALREGDLDETGAWTADADLFSLVEIVRPADATAAAPFRARLDAWRRRMTEGAE